MSRWTPYRETARRRRLGRRGASGAAPAPAPPNAADVGPERRPDDAAPILPTLLVFGAFSWYPIVQTVVMSLQSTNLVDAPTWVGLDNFRTVLEDPLLPEAIENTAYFALLASSSAIRSRLLLPC